jgi:multidrug efflux pump subunit AcrA (membrane-fusion protein)
MYLRRLAAGTLLAWVAILAGCHKEVATDARTLPEMVQVVSVSNSGSGRETFTGTVVARVQSDLGFRVSGKITQRVVDVGQSVHKGQVLMRIDPARLPDSNLATLSRNNEIPVSL